MYVYIVGISGRTATADYPVNLDKKAAIKESTVLKPV